MTLPIQTIIETHQALSDWRFTAQEANQIIVSVWESVMGAVILTVMMGMFGMVVSGKPDVEEELEGVEKQIKRTAFKLHDLEESAAHAREHYLSLMIRHGFTVTPSEVEMKRYPDIRMAKKRWDELEKRTERTRGYLFKLTRRRKELKGEV